MYYKLLIILSFFISSFSIGQNLVVNPSFEDYNNCPDHWTQIYEATGWSGSMGGVELYHSCSQVYGVPSNPVGYQYAHSGLAYAGFIVFENQIDSLDYREFLFGTLTQPLVIGTKYYISIKVNLAVNGVGHFSCCGSNKLGLRFSNNPNSKEINNLSHVYTDIVHVDTTNWVSIQGSFIADSAYSYLTIGNFWEKIYVSADTIDYQGTYSYYFIDDVCVSTDSMECDSTLGINENLNNDEFLMYPNPTSNYVTIQFTDSEKYNVKLSNFTGKIVEEQLLSKEFNRINLEHLLNGIYLVIINDQVFKRLIINR